MLTIPHLLTCAPLNVHNENPRNKSFFVVSYDVEGYLQLMASYTLHPNAMSGPDLAKIRSGLMRSKLMGKSQLVGGFCKTQGFGIAFTLRGIAHLRTQFPELIPFLDLISLHSPVQRFRPFWHSLFPTAQANAFYINVLELYESAEVTRHVDATLQGPSGLSDTVPRAVSVLYLSVPIRSKGGELKLFSKRHLPIATITPYSGLAVHFQGDLSHEITLVSQAPEPRLSLVCEQYIFSKRVLARLPEFQVQSRATDPIFSSGDTDRSFHQRLEEKSRQTWTPAPRHDSRKMSMRR